MDRKKTKKTKRKTSIKPSASLNSIEMKYDWDQFYINLCGVSTIR